MTHDLITVKKGMREKQNVSNQSDAAQQQEGINTSIQNSKLHPMQLQINSSPQSSIYQHSQPQRDPNNDLPVHNLSLSTLSTRLVHGDMPSTALLSISRLAFVVGCLRPAHARQLFCLVGGSCDGRVEDRWVGVVPLLSLFEE